MIKAGWIVPLLLAYFVAVSFFAFFIATQKRQLDDKASIITPVSLQTRITLPSE